MSNESSANPQSKLKQGVIRLNFADTRELYQAYMPYIDGCGIFAATTDAFKLEQEVFVFLQLPDDMGKFAVPGRVVWLNGPKQIGKRVPGVGIQIRGRDVERIRTTIEQALSKMLASGLPTATL